MDVINIITPVITLLFGSGIAWIFTIKYTRRQAEADAMQHFQSVYQGLIKDLQHDRTELREERNALSLGQEALRKEIYELKNVRIKQLEETVNANTRILKKLAQNAKAQSIKCKDCILIEIINNSQI